MIPDVKRRCRLLSIAASVSRFVDHVIVIGHGRLLRDEAISDFIAADAHHRVVVRSPQLDELAHVLTAAGANVAVGADSSIAVTEMDSSRIGDLAAAHGLTLHELATQQASLK